jgi:GTP-binding protein
MTQPQYQNARFLLSVATLEQLPPDKGVEVAFVGRSNAGKSSVLNQLTQNKNLARVSKTPGRTQLINVFPIDAHRRLIDLPGYGYAKVPLAMKKQWQSLLDAYLRSRDCLKGLVLVTDIRHPMKEFDQHMLAWAHQCGLSVHILLNKADKLNASGIKAATRIVQNGVAPFGDAVSLQIFSALKSTGIKELRETLDRWFCG